MTAPWINEDGGGFYDNEGEYVPGPDDFVDDPLDRMFERVWPESLDAAMRCLHCGAEVAWRAAARDGGGFTCPECGGYRSSANAPKSLRRRIGERDGWICHRCGEASDPALNWPHPLAPVADHYPISRAAGGPAIQANLRIAHSMCNGSSNTWVRARFPDVRTSSVGGEPEADEAKRPQGTIVVTPEQQTLIETIVRRAGRDGFPLVPPM